ncbi:hypothetical protein BWD42_07375 [Sphingobacterium sp. CZ-UAM]|uniref:RagB/SusD family nutrient uptake outer membrane protein n=1 Tax=Sphingobacterium sp. CZ-UAM TaxID=1933868 RepID=UPI000984AC3C|nr:RagB/SusD family nutrient uptake outer membrane protein [Sphingobacterium sp. CZ-UAM]OOG19715.1 hypothetical protein BWD42_07375 [Sphingobacterium sp. CZ-UAM]
MKKYIHKALLLGLLTGCLSCQKNFLKESSQDLIRPTTTTDLNQLLMGVGYREGWDPPIDILTDDITSTFDNKEQHINILNKYYALFTWQPDLLDQTIPKNPIFDLWSIAYQRIKGCNLVLDNIDKVSGPTEERENIRGQALGLRAYYYFMLVNFFARPYAAAKDPATELGVPLMLNAEVSDTPQPRASLQAVYEQIEMDLIKAISLLDQYGVKNQIYRLNNIAVRFILCRVYLYQQQWDKTIQYADAVLQSKSILQQYSKLSGNEFAVADPLSSPEVVWSIGSSNAQLKFMNSINYEPLAFDVDESLTKLLDSNDLRLKFGFTAIGVHPFRAKYGDTNGYALRTAEIYLNRAEAYIQKALGGDKAALEKALSDINTLRSNRLLTFSPLSSQDPQELYDFYKAERRRELCFENHRWFDLRRWGMPELQHSIQVAPGLPETFILKHNDPRYTLQIPREAMLLNPKLTQNPLN